MVTDQSFMMSEQISTSDAAHGEADHQGLGREASVKRAARSDASHEEACTSGKRSKTVNPADISGPLGAWKRLLPTTTKRPINSTKVEIAGHTSSTLEDWRAGNRLFFNARLVAHTSATTSGTHPAVHIASVDLMSHSQYFKARFASGFGEGNCDLNNLDVHFDISQQDLEAFIGSLYSGSMELSQSNVEVFLRFADYLDIPTVTGACQDYVLAHLDAWPLEVWQLGTELGMDRLSLAAQECILSQPWGTSRQSPDNIKTMLAGQSAHTIRELLHQPTYALCELQVVELARLAPDTFPLDIVDFSLLHPEEVAALCRQHGTLSQEELFQPFWVQLSQRLLQWHVHKAPAPPQSSVLFWEVPLRPLLEADVEQQMWSPLIWYLEHAYKMSLRRRQVKLDPSGVMEWKTSLKFFADKPYHALVMGAPAPLATFWFLPQAASSLSHKPTLQIVPMDPDALMFNNDAGKEVGILAVHVKHTPCP